MVLRRNVKLEQMYNNVNLDILYTLPKWMVGSHLIPGGYRVWFPKNWTWFEYRLKEIEEKALNTVKEYKKTCKG